MIKKERIVELTLQEDMDDLGVNIISLVDSPAIQTSWVALSENEDIETKIIEMASQDGFGEIIDDEKVIYVDLTNYKMGILDYVKGVLALDILGKKSIKKDEKPVKKYKYSGPPAERNFCKAMLRINKLYTKEEIQKMSKTINTGFRHNNKPYSLFDYKGGVNCKHYWEDIDVFKNEDGTFVYISHGRVNGKPGEAANASNNYWRFSAINEDQQIVTGPIMIPDLPIKRQDPITKEIFYVYFSEETIKKASEKFFKTLKVNNTDIQHSENITDENTLLESWIIENPEQDKSKLYGYDLPKGTWMVSYRINNENTWKSIKSGELNGFSIDGNFIQN